MVVSPAAGVVSGRSVDPGNAQHQGDRREQQDAFGFSDPADGAFLAHGGVAAVIADGMGGLPGGAEASSLAVAAFLDAYQHKEPGEAIPRALEHSLDAAHAAVCASARGSGTTLVAAAWHGLSLYWISAGDSALFLFRHGQLSLLTNAHVFARALEVAVAREQIAISQALKDPDRDCLTSYLGMPRMPEADRNLTAFPLAAGDRVLLATDGLYKVLSQAEIAAAIGGSSQESCERLVQRVLDKSAPQQDNITALMLTAQAGPPDASPTRQSAAPPRPAWERYLFWRRAR